MDTREAAAYLRLPRDEVRRLVTSGLQLAGSASPLCLKATPNGKDFEIDEPDLDAFLLALDAAEPHRHPPVAVQRALRVEADNQCEICRGDGPFEFHHILDWARLKHHDPEHMLFVCCNCHGKITAGQIDRLTQRAFKRKHQTRAAPPTPRVVRIDWSQLATLIHHLDAVIRTDATADGSALDFTAIDLSKKNELNDMSDRYFEMMRDHCEPHFRRVHEFLTSPGNEEIARTYHAIVDEIRVRFAAVDSPLALSDFLTGLYDAALDTADPAITSCKDVLTVLTSYMYFTCDIGRKA